MLKSFFGSLNDVINLKEKTSFLIGAGISIDPPSSLPSARELSKYLLNEYIPSEELDKIMNHPNSRYELMVEKIQNLIDHELRFLDYLDMVVQPNLNHIFLTQAAQMGSFLITTNFDYLLEYACKYYQKTKNTAEFLPIILKEDFLTYQNIEALKKTNKIPIIKIHGSKRDISKNINTSDSLITTLSSFGRDKPKDELFSIETYKKALINDIMKNCSLIVIGYSGNDDFDITPLLRDIKELKKLIWIEHAPEMGDKIQIEQIENAMARTDQQGPNLSRLDQQLIGIKAIPYNNGLQIFKIKARTNILVQKLIQDYDFDSRLPEKNQKNDTIIQKIPFDEWMSKNKTDLKLSMKYLLAGHIYYDIYQLQDAFRCIQKAEQMFADEKDTTSQVNALKLAGNIYRIKGWAEESFQCFNYAMSLLKNTDNLSLQASVFLDLALAYETKREHNNAKETAEKSLQLYEKLGDDIGISMALSYIGQAYNGWEKYEIALQYLNQALEINEKKGDLFGKVTILNYIAETYTRWAKNEESIKRYKEIIAIYDLLSQYYDKAIASYNLAMTYQIMGQYDLAIEILEDALSLARKSNSLNIMPMLLMKQDEMFASKREFEKAISLCQEAIEICKKLNCNEKTMNTYENHLKFLNSLSKSK